MHALLFRTHNLLFSVVHTRLESCVLCYHVEQIFDIAYHYANLFVSDEYLTHIPLLCQDLRLETLTKYDVRTVPDTDTLVFPTFSIDGSLSGVRVMTHRSADPEAKVKRRVSSRTIPR